MKIDKKKTESSLRVHYPHGLKEIFPTSESKLKYGSNVITSKEFTVKYKDDSGTERCANLSKLLLIIDADRKELVCIGVEVKKSADIVEQAEFKSSEGNCHWVEFGENRYSVIVKE